MIEPKLVVCGHQRSGNHYLAALIATNFFDSRKYESLFTRNTHSRVIDIQHDFKYIYIVRNQFDVLRSIYNLKNRFCFEVNSFDEFLDSNYCQSVNPSLFSDCRFRTLEVNQIFNQPDLFFKDIKLTPSQYHWWHYRSWRSISILADNVKVVFYEDLIDNFLVTMDSIRQFIDTPDPGSYNNIETRVGWSSI